MQEKVRLLAKEDVKKKSPAEIQELIETWRRRFLQSELHKADAEYRMRAIFIENLRTEYKSNEDISQKLHDTIKVINEQLEILYEKSREHIAAKLSFMTRTFNKARVSYLQENEEKAREDCNTSSAALTKFVRIMISTSTKKCVGDEKVKRLVSNSPAKMKILIPHKDQFEDGDGMYVRSIDELFERLEQQRFIPSVQYTGDDLLRYNFQEEYFNHLKKAIPDAAKKKKLNRLKAQAASNADEQRSLSSSIRSELNFQKQLQKINFCPYCGESFQTIKLSEKIHLDHIYPVSKGGHSVAENLVFICETCNNKKSNTTLTKFCLSEGINLQNVTERLLLLKKDI